MKDTRVVCLLLVIKREVHRRLTYECRCDDRLRGKAEGSTHLTLTQTLGSRVHRGLEQLKIETRLIN